jgi:hypothetical protein
VTPLAIAVIARKVTGLPNSQQDGFGVDAVFTNQATLDSGPDTTAFNCEFWWGTLVQWTRTGDMHTAGSWQNGFTTGQSVNVNPAAGLMNVYDAFKMVNGPGPADAKQTGCLQDLAIIAAQAFD